MKRTSIFLLSVVLALYWGAACAQNHEDAPEKPPRPCSGAEYRQFDFWLGEWRVEANGKHAGNSRITAILGGCVIFEEWESAAGKYAGKSFNRFDANDRRWHQVWVDNQGTVLDLAGAFADGKMVLEGESLSQGQTVRNRITWHNNDDGTVRQVWETSADGGNTWKAIFDGMYRRGTQDG